MSTESAKADAGLKREASKTSAEKELTGELPDDQLPAIHVPELEGNPPAAVHSAIRPKIEYSSAGAFFRSVGR